MKNKNTLILALILLVVVATSIFVFAGGVKGTTGKSAYELAVENGYTGSQTQWLSDLQGKDGQDAEAIDYYALYTSAKESGDIPSTTSYLSFIQSYIANNASAIENKELYAIQNSLRCSVAVFAIYENSYGIDKNSAGSGTFIEVDDAGNAKVLTNFHVTYTDRGVSGTEYYVMLYEDNYLYSNFTGSSSMVTAATIATIREEGIPATYFGGDKNYDLAVLKIEDSQKLKNAYSKHMVTAAQFADDNEIVVGTNCYAVGNPMGEGISASQGIVSISSENITIKDVENVYGSITIREIRTSCNINGGNSGGGLFNEEGKLIGVINARREIVSAINSERVDGVSFAIPLSVVESMVIAINNQCDGITTSPTHHLMGIQTNIDSSYAEYNFTTGLVELHDIVVIDEILSGYPAASSSLQVGDILVSFSVEFVGGGNSGTIDINHSYTLSDYVLRLSAGDKVTINYNRDVGGTLQSGSVTITLV